MKTRLDNIKIRIKDVFRQWMNSLIHKLNAINLWLNNDCNPNPKGYEDLTPTDDGDKDKKYSEALEWALRNKRVKNIALTGAYGSGKSSILRTFEKEHKGYNYLNISLASFTDSEVNDSNDRENPNIDRLIELSILQQMFYHIKHKSVPDSQFKRIKGLKGKRLLLKSLEVIIWLVAVLLLWQPKFIQSITIWKDYNNISNRNLDFVLLAIVLYGLGIIISKSIRIANNAKLNKLNIQSDEIEISENIDSSILNKHLDEILYFFEVTTYNVVIIEDLDRFNNTDIFTKLRELNILINNSRQINRRVVFIYTIKDDMFRDKNRTKFFDFIIPVIPVINITNSGDMLHNKLRNNDSENTISTNFIDDVSMYIDDMRLLKNICNEYAIYKEKLSPKLHHDNLLAMIIYKNIFPSDFVDLHNGKGKVFSVFDSKLTLINGRINNINTEIESCREKIKEVEDICINYIQELRAIYIYAIIEKLSSIHSFYINNTEYNFSTIKETEIGEKRNKILDITAGC
jgi:hypothetical protein